MSEDKYFIYDCPKCKNNHWKGKTISRCTPSIKQDIERKEYYKCYNCNYEWYVNTLLEKTHKLGGIDDK